MITLEAQSGSWQTGGSSSWTRAIFRGQTFGLWVEKVLDGFWGFYGKALILAVGCAIEMGLPVCVSAKANFHIDSAGITVTHTRRCVLRRLLLLKCQQMHALESESHLFLLRHLQSTMRVWKKSQIWKVSVCYHPAHPWWLKLLMPVPQKWPKGLQISSVGLSKLLDNIKKKFV